MGSTPDDPPVRKIEYGWFKVMPCIGLQFGSGPIAIDFRLPIGIEFLSANGTDYAQNSQDLALEPTVSVGLEHVGDFLLAAKTRAFFVSFGK